MRSLIFSSTLIFSLLVLLSACGDDDAEDAGMASVQFSLTDDPAEYDSVLIDIREVNYNVGGDDTGWESVPGFVPGIYDLLTLSNGKEMILGNALLPDGKLNQVRLVLGSNNTLVIDSTRIDLTVPSGSESGLKVKLNTQIVGGVTYKVLIDFDASKSVVKAGNSGNYNLKPVLRAELEALSGVIRGVVAPDTIKSVVYAIMNGDTNTTYTDDNGVFQLAALEAGTYEVYAMSDSVSGLMSQRESLALNTGQAAVTDTLFLSK